MSHPRTTRNGMTAVEVLASTLLASLMLGSVIGVLGGLTRQQRELLDSSHSPNWHDQFAEQLHWDLQNSREVVSTEYGVRLNGFAGRDFVNGQPTGRPTAIEYYLVESGDSAALVRREEHLDARTNDNWRIELVCSGIHAFEFGSAKIRLVTSGVQRLGATAEANPTPRTITVQIPQTKENAIAFDRQFILR